MNLDTYELSDLLRKAKGFKRVLSERENLSEIRIAVLCGSTTNEVVDLLELHLLTAGFRPTFHVGEYGAYFEESVIDPTDIIAFRPDFVYVFTSYVNLKRFPPLNATEDQVRKCVDSEVSRFRQIWDSIRANVGCQVIQNSFELPPYALLGNLDSVVAGGRSRFIQQLDLALAEEASKNPMLLLQDLLRVSSEVGLARWYDWERWFSYKISVSSEGSLAIARSVAAQITAVRGRSRKVLVLDLDNTVWGGIIGDDGADKILIGRETPIAEAYTAFQEYCLLLKDRGVLLAVCSKNDEENAKQGFSHPDSVLKLEDISCFKANWNPKHENIRAIAEELNLGVDSFVFADDNPAERVIVEAQIPGIAVPDIGNEAAQYASILQAGRYFEAASLTAEDLERAKLYASNSERATLEGRFANYGEYLDSLEMTAEIDTFKPVYLERIAQLTNKTNQFNLTTKRYTLAEIESISRNSRYLGIYGRLTDRFGDNGLISVVIGELKGRELDIHLWLMSCRVLKRGMEHAMLDAVAQRAREMGATSLVGHYIPSAKNSMVADHFAKLGFKSVSPKVEAGQTSWSLDLNDYEALNTHIRILETIHA